MKTNGKKLIKAGLLTLVLFIGFSAFSQAPDMQLSYVNGWLDQLSPTLKDTLTIILGFAGGYFLAALGILYVRNSEDEKGSHSLFYDYCDIHITQHIK